MAEDKRKNFVILNIPSYIGLIAATWTCGAIVGASFKPLIQDYQKNHIPFNERPSSQISYDINGDGLEDTISKYGTVNIRQEDGSYSTLSEEIEKASNRYRLEKGPDGRYYTQQGLEKISE